MNQENTTGICAEEYTVKRGDSFYLIAHKLGVPLRDLLAANRDIHPARLMVGDVLCIPREEDTHTVETPTQPPVATPVPLPEVVIETPVPSTPAQPSTPQEPIVPPTPSVPSTPPENTMPSTPPQPAEPSPNCPETEQWIVQKGQTVSDLQLRNLVSRHTLESANPGVDLETLRVGQTLCIPRENIPCELPETYTLCEGETLEAVAVRFNLPVASLLRANPCLAPQDFEGGVTVVLPR